MLVTALGGADTAAACHGTPVHGQFERTAFVAADERVPGSLLTVTAKYLGLDPATLKSDLESGKTIADVAPAGKTAAGLADAYASAAKTYFDVKVAAGKMTQTQENGVLAKIDQKLPAFADKLWTRSFVDNDGKVVPVRNGVAHAYAYGHHLGRRHHRH